MNRALLALVAASAAACGGSNNPVSYSQPVDITLPNLASKSTTTSALSTTPKDITTAGSNPYGAFVNAAVQHIGRNPSHIAVTSLTLSMTTTPPGLTFDQVFASTSTVIVRFVMNGSGTSYPVGAVAGPAGLGPVSLAVAFDSCRSPKCRSR